MVDVKLGTPGPSCQVRKGRSADDDAQGYYRVCVAELTQVTSVLPMYSVTRCALLGGGNMNGYDMTMSDIMI